jgi:hypothetical protein
MGLLAANLGGAGRMCAWDATKRFPALRRLASIGNMRVVASQMIAVVEDRTSPLPLSLKMMSPYCDAAACQWARGNDMVRSLGRRQGHGS